MFRKKKLDGFDLLFLLLFLPFILIFSGRNKTEVEKHAERTLLVKIGAWVFTLLGIIGFINNLQAIFLSFSVETIWSNLFVIFLLAPIHVVIGILLFMKANAMKEGKPLIPEIKKKLASKGIYGLGDIGTYLSRNKKK